MSNLLKIGDKAPDFQAEDQDGAVHTLADYKGKWLVLYFYPKDNTPGCTKEACAIRDSYGDILKLAEIVGVSGDSVKSHKNFAAKYNLPFNLLADPEKKILNSYGANGEILNKRSTFVIDPDGKIARIYEKVDPAIHAAQIITDLTVLQT
jgi:peroxiredoxin Q/BCP